MSDRPKSFRELAWEMRQSRAYTNTSENADRYRGFDAGQLRAAEYVERLADEWERHLTAMRMLPGVEKLFTDAQIMACILGAKERR